MTSTPQTTTVDLHASIFRHVLAPAPRYMMRLALLEAQLSHIPNVKHFIEIGPGLGDVSLFLSDRYPESRGDLIDSATGSETITRARVLNRPQLRVLQGDFRELSGQSQYDLVVACEVFEHIEDDDSAFAAVQALLHPGGHFLFSVPAFRSHWQAGDEYAGHYRRYERSELISKFSRHGLDINLLWCYGFPLTNFLNPLTHIYYRYKLRNRTLSRKIATEHSGIERDIARRFPVRSIAALLWPFIQIQYLARERNVGDGFLILAHRK